MLKHSHSSLNMFEQCPKRYYHQRIAKDVIDTPTEASMYGDRVHKSLEDRVAHGIPLPPELMKHENKCQSILDLGGEVVAEKEFALTKELVPTGWRDADAWIRSKLDIFTKKEHKVAILDWKTGRRKLDFSQLRLSAMQTFLHYPEVRVVSVAFVWLKDNLFDVEFFKRRELPDFVQEFKEKIARVELAAELGVWQAKPGPLCGWCPAQDICEFAQKRR